ncbi:helix-turn-helix domain-containing protein [Pedobacter steynii]|uniref:Transcriptional regulator n=1 Tax=Pedobacter steynii TaxID=430522 RepID=A0A1D7QNK7_9SPHI|nr:pentapeptide repeat-containing protein [Pedobacter steynii]AOM80237.1 transcriptional regulator [Pedobacter steynii]
MLSTKMIGNKIIKARKEKNLSQAQLAERLFISSQAVGKWERGESMPDITTFSRIAEILGVDLNYFSDNFQSEVREASAAETLVKPSDELPSLKREKKFNWDMSRGNWVDANFSGLKNLHEKLSSSNMQRCIFIGSDLSGLLLKSNNLDSCDFSNSDISGSHIQTSQLDNNLFKNSFLKTAKFSKSHIKFCDFSGSDISNSHIQSSHFENNLFKYSSMKEVNILRSHFKGCDFSDADFTGMEFKSGGFVHSKIVNAVWNHSSFIGVQIEDIVFDSNLEDCYFENCSFNWVKFQSVTLINTFFKDNRFKRIQFVDCQADQITYEFLKSGKADLTGIRVLTP